MAEPNPTISICRWKHDAPFAYSMTYDEGTEDCMDNALPLHERYGVPGHVDVVAGQLGQARNCWGSSLNGRRHVSAEQLRELIARGWGVGNHSWSHFVWPEQPGIDLWREVVWSKYRLEEMIDHPVRVFTIPNDMYNYDPAIGLIRQHYLACLAIDGGVNRDDVDLYRVGNYLLAADGPRPRPGWPEELKTDRLTAAYLRGGWLLDTTHLCMDNVPQPHKCITPDALQRRFETLGELSAGRMWAARVDDVIDYILLRRTLRIENVRRDESQGLRFDVLGDWPVGLIDARLTLRIRGADFGEPPQVSQNALPGSTCVLRRTEVESVRPDGQDWLVTMELTPGRSILLQG
jgi:peptidoglycan/xylan/chitin deacetylase (PgdA/CDA1 family)